MTNLKTNVYSLAQKVSALFFATTGLLIFSDTAAAQVAPPQAPPGIENPVIGNLGADPGAAESGATFLTYFVYLWNVLIQVGGLALIAYFLWGAFEWLTSGGESGKLQSARNKMLHAALGLALLVSSFVLIAFIGRLLFGPNFNILTLTFPTPN